MHVYKTQQENYPLPSAWLPVVKSFLVTVFGNCYRIASWNLVSLFWPGLLPEPQSIRQIYSG